VIIATPDHWHAHMAIGCLQGEEKNVYLEKPLTFTIREGQLAGESSTRKRGNPGLWGSQTAL